MITSHNQEVPEKLISLSNKNNWKTSFNFVKLDIHLIFSRHISRRSHISYGTTRCNGVPALFSEYYLLFITRFVVLQRIKIKKVPTVTSPSYFTKTQVKVVKESHWYDSNKSWQKLFIQTSSVFKISQLITLLTEIIFEIVAPMIIQLSHQKSKTLRGRGGHSSFSSMLFVIFFLVSITFDLTETKLIGVLCSSDLWEGSESESALHLTYVIVQNCGRAECLR